MAVCREVKEISASTLGEKQMEWFIFVPSNLVVLDVDALG